ncbi:enoyl-CoA hydratase-related protein [Candidatus Sororendozoicomonas aggregata]|uniref:enoyl-CoA hydratase-related protein n=1 Tax=Candidatus Sororendozoicomonas aggregata TaxID=3073239 RepID=UPI002ED29990
MTDNMPDKKLLVNRASHGVVELTLNRPKVNNALDEALISELDHTLQALVREDARVLILRARGNHFSAGADIGWMQKAQTLTQQENYQDALKLASFLKRLSRFPAPVITAVQGAAYGGALGLIAASDITVAADNSRFCFSEVKLGLIPSVISPYVISAMGARQARRYFLTAEVFDATEANALGLVHQICDLDGLNHHVDTLVSHLLKGGPVAHNNVKKMMGEVTRQPFSDELMALTAKRIAAIRITEEATEGLGAFFDKRKPKWDAS